MTSPEPLLPPELVIDEEPFREMELDWYLMPSEERPGGLISFGDGSTINERARAVDRFEVDDNDKAEWAMAHVATIDAEMHALAEQRLAYVQRIDVWHARNANLLANRRRFFEDHLVAYLRSRREADENLKSISLPSGQITSRRAAAKIVVADEQAAIGYLKGNFDMGTLEMAGAIKVTEKLLVSKLGGLVAIDGGRAVDFDGEVPVPGLGVEPERVTYDVKPSL